MTEKRFNCHVKFSAMPNGIMVLDYERHGDEQTVIEDISREKAHRVMDRLNELNNENEQLKQYIYDNLDEDICDVCIYQYLEKSQMDKYYIAKCKKGYDNCSKGTVIHCKDFKFKELE